MTLKTRDTLKSNLNHGHQNPRNLLTDLLDSVPMVSGTIVYTNGIVSGSDPGVAGKLFTTCSVGNDDYDILVVSKGS